MRRATLNHTYKLKWDHIKRAFIAVSEIAKGKGKQGKAILIAGMLVSSECALADLPAIENFTLHPLTEFDSVSISYDSATNNIYSYDATDEARVYGLFESSEKYLEMPISGVSFTNDGSLTFVSNAQIDSYAGAVSLGRKKVRPQNG